ncbi:cell division protein SepF [Caviibacter abscessus]|uniref:cell division protein SepF n=1 Tax=Caviibacter abscessus TaxID=1766719 RepID=UPI0008374579|nr:cell division protein SepF [Caviibacter abscessus]
MKLFNVFKEDDEKEEINNIETEQEYVATSGCINITRPTSYKDGQSLIEPIKKGNIVSFSLEQLNQEEGQRLIDFIAGATYALGGNISKITDKVFISIPKGMKLEELQLGQEV